MAAVTTTGTKLQSHEPNWINTWFNATLSQVVVVVVVAGGGGGGGSAGWGDQGRYTLPPHSVYTERYVASTITLLFLLLTQSVKHTFCQDNELR